MKCDSKVQFQSTITHFEDHKGFKYKEVKDFRLNTKIRYNYGYCYKYSDSYWPPEKVKLHNDTFLSTVKIEDKIVYMWVYILGSPKKAQKYSYTLKLFGSKATTTFEGKVAAIDETFEDLCDAGKCYGVPFKLFESQVVDENRNFTISLNIQSVK